MTITDAEVQNAINAGELVASETHHNGHTCAVNNVTLLALIAAAKELLANGIWSKRQPKAEGIYAFRCGETDGKAEYAKIYKKLGVLMVDSEHLDKISVPDFCDGLTAVEWRAIQ